MRPLSLNEGWTYRHLNSDEPPQAVSLPHDAMLFEPRDPAAPSAQNGCWFVGRDYEYLRTLEPDECGDGESLVLELEGVYHLAEVYVNGVRAAERPYGYTGFYVDLTDLLIPASQNELRVVARNSDQPNSRWYSGAGIYRPVTLWSGSAAHIRPDGLWANTTGVDPCAANVRVECTGAGSVTVELISSENGKPLASSTAPVGEDGLAHLSILVPEASPWSPESPKLYTLRATLAAADGSTDVAECDFGFRTLEWGNKGLFMNGERLLLKGACIHHDNGILGASCWPDAVDRKVALLKAQGYNAVRSAHNPCSKALLAACDRQGVLVMDEYIDHWYIHKTIHDFVEYFPDWWGRDLESMVRKDVCHPCVVLYSTGNEVSETAEPRGIDLCGCMTEFLHELDPTRPVTCGVNIFFNFLSSIGFGQYSDEKAAKEAADPGKHEAVGSEFFNNLAGIMGAGFMKRGATLPACDRVTREAYARMDVAGYNYGIRRYAHDLRAYPDRLILGSETFCADAAEFMEMAEREPRLVGDFVWAGIDYLGETSVGAWEYADYAKLANGYGWMTAGSGRLDLTGKPLGEAFYTRVALGGETGPYVAVCPVNHTGDKHSPSAWKMSNAMDSWAWDGCGGKRADVEVYARAARVNLLLNGREVGSRRVRGCVARMNVAWEPGELVAVALDANGLELGRRSLASETGATRLVAELDYVGTELAFIRVRYVGDKGLTRPLARGALRASASGGAELLAFGCAAPYNEGSYVTGETGTYYGEALAVCRGHGKLSVSDGTLSASIDF